MNLPIGIDLGTTNSAIAVFRNGQSEIIPNTLGDLLTPSVVSVDGESVLVGKAARDRLATHPNQTAGAFKRSMGTDKTFRLGSKSFRAEDLSSLVLRKLKMDAEAYLGQSITDVVVSVPAYFNQAQRDATATACRLTGLNAKRLINEPTAAAIAYGLQDRDGESMFLVFDLGGGTFDVTVLEYFDRVMQVKASSGDAFLGGDDFTRALAGAIAEQMGRPWARLGRDLQRQILLRADEAKRRLSSDDVNEVTVREKGRDIPVRIDRALFESAVQPLVKRLYRPIERCFYDSEEDIETLNRVILVGGATRMPLIRQIVARHFRMLPEMTIDPDLAVALGAAAQAGLVAKDQALDEMVMTDVSPFSVGIGVSDKDDKGSIRSGYFSPIIERNTPLPVSREQEYATLQDGQKEIEIEIFQGEAPRTEDNSQLGKFRITVPRGRAGEQEIAVRITYNTSGLIEVDARALSTQEKGKSLVIRTNAAGLDEDEIARQLRQMAKLKLHPRNQEENTALLARLRRVYELASGHDRPTVQRMLIDFEAALADQEETKIVTIRDELNDALDTVDDFYVT